MNDRLYRSRDDRIIAGVAGGLAEQFRIDPSLVRILWVILVVPTGGLALLLYIVMAFIVPEEPAGDARWAAWDRGPGGDAWPGDAGMPGGSGGMPLDAGAMGGTGMGTAAPGGAFAMSEPAPTAGGTSPVSPATPATGGPASGDGGPLGVPAGFAPGGAGFSGSAPGPAAGSREAWREQRRAWRDERRAARQEHRDGFGALLFGLILILVGGYFLVRAYVPAIDADRSWPFLLLGIGVVLLFGAIRRSNGSSGG